MGMDYGSHYAPIGSSNVLLVMIDDVAYSPNVEALHTIFSTYGHVLKMTIFEKSGNWQVGMHSFSSGRASVGRAGLQLCSVLSRLG